MHHSGSITVVISLALLAGCATGSTSSAPTTEAVMETAKPTLQEVAFQAALTDASGQSQANVYDGLFAITDGNPKLVWKDPSAKTTLKVVSLMSQSSYDSYYKGSSSGTTTGVYSWVTLAPQMKEFCQSTGLSGDALKDRLREHLGLVPDAPYDMFVEFWVDRSDLFRPCPDPQTNDTQCEVAFAQKDGQPVNPTVKGVDDYLGWFNGTYAWAYAPGGAPWTRLGYTYDWNPDTPKFGASEYLITAGANWVIADAQTTDAYCAVDK